MRNAPRHPGAAGSGHRPVRSAPGAGHHPLQQLHAVFGVAMPWWPAHPHPWSRPRRRRDSITTNPKQPTTEGRTMARNTTLLDLMNAVFTHARTEAEVLATVVYLVNSGRVRLCGTFKGARFDLGSPDTPS